MRTRRVRTGIDAGRRLMEGVGTFRGPLLPARRRNGALQSSLRHWTSFALIVSAHEIEIRLERALAEKGISLRDFVVLAEIGRRSGVIQGDLANHIGIGRSRLSEQLSVLETDGLIERLLDQVDLRCRRIWLTRDGRQLLAEGSAAVDGIERGWLARFDRREAFAFRSSASILPPHWEPPQGWRPATSDERP